LKIIEGTQLRLPRAKSILSIGDGF